MTMDVYTTFVDGMQPFHRTSGLDGARTNRRDELRRTTATFRGVIQARLLDSRTDAEHRKKCMQ